MNRLVALILFTGLLAGADARATGFMIFEHNAAATAMSDSRTAVADDVSAIFYNPAALSELDGLQLQLGVTGILPYVSYEAAKAPADRFYISHLAEEVPVNDGQNDMDAKIRGFTPVHIYASYSIPGSGVTLGYGLFEPFGLGTFWPGEWDGRFIATETDMATFFNQPTISVDVAELLGFKDRVKLSVAAGYNLVYATALLARRIDMRAFEPLFGEFDGPYAEMKLTGDAIGHGWNFALYAEIPGIVAFGASVRSGISLGFDGTARFSFDPGGQTIKNTIGLKIPDETGGSVTVDLPMNMNFGVALLAIEDLTVALDFYVAFFESYDQLELEFECLGLPTDAEGYCEHVLTDLDGDGKMDPLVTDWGTGWQLSLGVEYRLTEAWAIRAGYGLVTSPVPAETYDPSLPDGRRDLFCLGGGYKGDWFKVDLGYMLAVWEGEKDNDVGDWDDPDRGPEQWRDGGSPNGKANGRYTTAVHLLALTFSVWL